MRCEQIAGWLMFGMLLACSHGNGQSVPAKVFDPIARPTGGVVTAASRSDMASESGPPLLTDVRRVALIEPDLPEDEIVRQAVEAERAMRSRRRRPNLFAPKPPVQPRKPNNSARPKSSVNTGKSSGIGRQTKTAPETEPPDSMTVPRLHAIAEILFIDALRERLSGRLNLEVASYSETQALLKKLKLSPGAIGAGGATIALCRELGCDAVIIPSVGAIRTKEAGTRAIGIWANVRVFRPRAGNMPATAPDAAESENPIRSAGAAVTDRAPFQDRFLRGWPQLCGDAARQAAAIAARTLATGVVAPFVREGDRIAIAPVAAPAQADALVFHMGGRIVAPAVLQHLPTDLTTYFHPDLLPLFPDSVVTSRLAPIAFTGEAGLAERFWKSNETPEPTQTVALGRRAKVQYVLLARVSDLQISIENPSKRADGMLQDTVSQTNDAGLSEGRPYETATAEAIGALVRVSDGAVLWRDRTTATTTATRKPWDLTGSRRRLAFDAERFSLLQLDRRFRQYRRRFE